MPDRPAEPGPAPRAALTAWLALLVVLLGVAMYLPGLGTPELRGEEPRRALPARDMLQTGDWLVPKWAGEAYSRKPPLVNWAAAASISMTGKQDEATIRLPSMAATTAMALALFLLGARLIGTRGALTAAVLFLVSKAVLDKGHVLEIEALYVFTFGAAWLWWLRFDATGRPWTAWLGAGVFLGLGMLAKGPLHVFFFLSLILGMKGWKSVRELIRLPALCGWAICAALFLAWAIPNQQLNASGDSAEVWSSQLMNRLGFADFDFVGWITGVPRILLDFTPAVLFLALIPRMRREGIPTAGLLTSAQAYRILLVCVGWILLIGLGPSLRPRFVMPLLVPVCLLAGLAASSSPAAKSWMIHWKRAAAVTCGILGLALLISPFLPDSGISPRGRVLLPLIVAFGAWTVWRRIASRPPELIRNVMLTGIAGILAWQVYLHVAWPQMKNREVFRPIAAEVTRVLGLHQNPSAPPVYALGMEEQPFLFYLGAGCREIAAASELPARPPILLLREKDAEHFMPEIVNKYGPPKRHTLIPVSQFRSKWKLHPVVALRWDSSNEQ